MLAPTAEDRLISGTVRASMRGQIQGGEQAFQEAYLFQYQLFQQFSVFHFEAVPVKQDKHEMLTYGQLYKKIAVVNSAFAEMAV